jgi:hypothetical protein
MLTSVRHPVPAKRTVPAVVEIVLTDRLLKE